MVDPDLLGVISLDLPHGVADRLLDSGFLDSFLSLTSSLLFALFTLASLPASGSLLTLGQYSDSDVVSFVPVSVLFVILASFSRSCLGVPMNIYDASVLGVCLLLGLAGINGIVRLGVTPVGSSFSFLSVFRSVAFP